MAARAPAGGQKRLGGSSYSSFGDPTASGRKDVGRTLPGRRCSWSRSACPKAIRPDVRRSSASWSTHADRRERRQRVPAQASGSVSSRLLARARRTLPPKDPRVPPLGAAVLSAQLATAGGTATSDPPAHDAQLVSHDLQRARGPSDRGCARDRSESGVPRCRSTGSRVRARAPPVPIRPHGDVISERFTLLTYPWHWHFTFLRGLDYLRLTPSIADERLTDSIELLRERRKPNGRWPLQKRIPGTLLVEMEKPGQDSRWNTLRALRVLRAR